MLLWVRENNLLKLKCLQNSKCFKNVHSGSYNVSPYRADLLLSQRGVFNNKNHRNIKKEENESV